ncbi:glycosyltransferase family A protein [Empedobacter sp.]|uniref:glycosyltransferase family 2 protein n=1 Tax=Empedobacter sp. TaxID=1927715 RepID=UPI00289B0935|nr:glycosyltransferase family A protein [Empedobacter sp.]
MSNNNKNLAIIIPAYKTEYLEQTFESFVNQTVKKFVIYVGDDNSPNNVKEIVDKFANTLNIVYKRFDENLGSVSLTKQWERCINLSHEQWIWLFSDDDIVSRTAVENFYNAVENKPNSQLFKFFTKIINDDGKEVTLFFDKTNKKIDKISPQYYLDKRLAHDRFRSYMVEYVFHRQLFEQNKFVDFPLAWAADDATWIKYSLANGGIDIIPDYVYWRYSGNNISSDKLNSHIVEKKLLAIEMYVNWLKKQNKNKLVLDNKLLIRWTVAEVASMFEDRLLLEKYIFNTYKDCFKENEIKDGLRHYYKVKRRAKILKFAKTFIGR